MFNDYLFYGAIGVIVLILFLVFPPTRAVIAWLLGDRGVIRPIGAFLGSILRAHIVVLRNFLPRSVIYPTLEAKRRTNQQDQSGALK
ncbi:MAG: hypothetical protein NT159_07340 [Proteobacteria bacterium]|nr:hypothetical protein [Pseudomonadota bacterium]